MLEQLAKHDDKWQRIALSICQNPNISKDIVNDMYIKLHDSGKKYDDINDWYVYRTLYTLFMDYLREQKKTQFTSYENIEAVNDNEMTNTRKEMDELLDKLPYFDREILLHTSERSLRKNEEYLGITIRVLFYSRKKALEKLKVLYNKSKN